jgi:hypothetical protein
MAIIPPEPAGIAAAPAQPRRQYGADFTQPALHLMVI